MVQPVTGYLRHGLIVFSGSSTGPGRTCRPQGLAVGRGTGRPRSLGAGRPTLGADLGRVGAVIAEFGAGRTAGELELGDRHEFVLARFEAVVDGLELALGRQPVDLRASSAQWAISRRKVPVRAGWERSPRPVRAPGQRRGRRAPRGWASVPGDRRQLGAEPPVARKSRCSSKPPWVYQNAPRFDVLRDGRVIRAIITLSVQRLKQ